MKNITFLFLLSVFFLISPPVTEKLGAQEAAPEGEAPAHILDMDIGSVGTDVYWQGYWRYRFTYGTGYENGPDGWVFPASFSGLQQGFEFKQEPDFFLSVFLLDHYFLETSITEGYDRNTYVMGYMGGEEDPVKEVRIGNAGIGIGEYRGIDVSSPEYNTPGISGRFESMQSEHEFMIRYDPTEEQSKTFVGSYEVTEEEILLMDYLEGQFFVLPDQGISSLRVYLEEDNGALAGSDGRRYTLITSGYTIDLEQGLLELDEPAEDRVVVFYRKGAAGVGEDTVENFIMDVDASGRPDPETAVLPFGWSEDDPYDGEPSSGTFEETSLVTIDGNDALLVHSPGSWSPFQSYNHYSYNTNLPSESWRTSITLMERGSSLEASGDFSFTPDDYTLTVQSGSYSARDAHTRVPFAEEDPALYGPGRTSDEQKISRNILISVKEDSSSYYLGSEIVKGSVKVKVNGTEDQTVEVNYDTGELIFSRYIFPDDRIEVTYRTESTGFGGGDLFMAQGNRLFLTPYLTLELAESLRWTIPESQVTEEQGDNPGRIDFASTLFYEKENLSVTAGAGVTIQTPDTAGNLRLHSMEDEGYSFSLSEDQLIPSEISLTPADSDYPEEDWTPLIYRDFLMTSNTGQTYLNAYEWDAPVDSSERGPSAAGSYQDDPFSSRVMVMTYDLEGSEWTGGDYLPVSDELIDLSGYSSLSFYLRRQNLEADNLKVKLILGENGESEDADENGSVEPGSSFYVVSKDNISLPAEENQWEKVTISLTTRERQKLSRVRSFRLLLSNSGGTGTSRGELLAGGFQGEGSPLVMQVFTASGTERDNSSLDAVETTEQTESLEKTFPEVDSVFHPDDDDQKVLKISWGDKSQDGTPLNSGEYWTGTSWMEGKNPGDYGELALYVLHEQTGGEGFIDLTDPEGLGIHISYEPGSTGWEKLTVNLEEGTAGFSGDSRINSLGFDKDAGELTRFTVGMTGLNSGRIYLDEVHFSNPLFTTRTSLDYDLTYAIPGTIAATEGGFPLLGNFNLFNRIYYSREDNSSLFSDTVNQLESQFSTGADVMRIRMEGDMDLKHNEENTLYTMGHLVRLPSSSRLGWVSDSYSRSFYPGEDVMSRENVLHLTPLGSLILEARSGSEGSLDQLVQQWGGSFKLSPYKGGSAEMEMDLFQTSGWESDSESYFSDWAADFSYYTPLDEDLESREGEGNAGFSHRGEIFGISWTPELSYYATETYQWEQTNTWETELAFPLEIPTGRGDISVEPGYRRSLENVIFPGEYSSFRDDWDTLTRGLESQFPLWNFVPLYEIFDTNGIDRFEDTLTLTDDSTYTPELYLSVSRMPGSRLSDLIAPSSVDISLDRTYRKDSDTLYREDHWSFQYVQSALNLFGSYGSQGYLDFYETDEWTSSLQYILSGREGFLPDPEELIYQNYINLLTGEVWEISLDNRYALQFQEDTWQEDLQFIFRWREPENPWIDLPLIDRLIVKTNYREHEERLEFGGDFDGEERENTTYDTIMTHQTSLIIEELGALKGWMSLGLGGKQEVFQNAFELGVELEITF